MAHELEKMFKVRARARLPVLLVFTSLPFKQTVGMGPWVNSLTRVRCPDRSCKHYTFAMWAWQ